MKKIIVFMMFILLVSSLAWGDVTSYDFSDSGAVSGLEEESPGISLDANIGFGSFKNNGTSDPAIYSGQLRLYQNATKGGSIKIYATNGVTITEVVVNASDRTGNAAYTVDGGSENTLAGGTTYTISNITATSEVEFYQKQDGSSNRIYVDSFEVTYTTGGTNQPPQITNIMQNPSEGIISTTTVEISADVTDDSSVSSVLLAWGTESGVLNNTIDMSWSSGDNYVTENDIPAQSDGTTVYYEIRATDGDDAQSVSNEYSYDVENLKVDFSANDTDVYVGDTVSFTDLTSGGKTPYLYSWDLDGDGNEDSDLENPTFVYDTVGDYTVILYVVDDNSTDETETKNAYIHVTNKPETPALFISEVADPADDYNGRFVELYNNSGSEIDFDSETWYLCFQANGGNWTDQQLIGSVLSGDCFVFSYEDDADFNTIYGVDPDQYHGSFNGNGDDGYFLYYGGDHQSGTLVDAYGVIDEDGTGKDWEYENSRALRYNVTEGNSTWTASEWQITPADVADCTPGTLDNDQALPVTLTSFTAIQIQNDQVQLSWQVESESDMMGYNLYRSIADSDEKVKISDLISAENLPYTHEYQYIDIDAEAGNTYDYYLESIAYDGSSNLFDPVRFVFNAIEDDEEEAPEILETLGNYPNPFNPSTTIKFSIDGASGKHVRLSIFNSKGQVVKNLVDEKLAKGNHFVVWNGDDNNGEIVNSGIYFYRLQINDYYSEMKKMVLVK